MFLTDRAQYACVCMKVTRCYDDNTVRVGGEHRDDIIFHPWAFHDLPQMSSVDLC